MAKRATRTEAVALINKQLGTDGWKLKPVGNTTHYGRQELRELLDLIYGSPPRKPEECLDG